MLTHNIMDFIRNNIPKGCSVKYYNGQHIVVVNIRDIFKLKTYILCENYIKIFGNSSNIIYYSDPGFFDKLSIELKC